MGVASQMKVGSQYEGSIYCSYHGETYEEGEEYFLTDHRYLCEECAERIKSQIKLLEVFSCDVMASYSLAENYDLKQIASAIYDLLNGEDLK